MASPVGVLFSDPRVKPLSTTGTYQPGCYLCFFTTGTTTPAPVYADGTITNQYSQPAPNSVNPSAGTVADSAGRFLPIYMNPAITYRVQLYNAAGVLLSDTDPYVVPPGITNTSVGNAIFPILSTETQVVNVWQPYGTVLRFGADKTGQTDSTQAFINCIASWPSVYVNSGTYAISSNLILNTNQTMYGDGQNAVLTFSNNSGNQITLATGCTVKGLQVSVSGTGANSYIGAIYGSGVSNCTVMNTYIQGFSGCGVFLSDSSFNFISGNTFNNAVTTQNGGTGNQDSSDIMLWGGTVGCSYNIITNNFCQSGCWYGIALETGPNLPDAASSNNNYIGNNRIEGHITYGILDYHGPISQPDRCNQIIGNQIANIFGSNPLHDKGMGIYIANVGGDIIEDNVIQNTCVNTTLVDLPLGAISINFSTTATGVSSPTIIANNIINGQTKYHGIAVSNGYQGTIPIIISGNSINMPSSNVGGFGVNLNQASNAAVSGNSIINQGTGGGVFYQTNTQNLTGINIVGNTITSLSSALYFATGSGTFYGLGISNNVLASSTSSTISVANLNQSAIIGNYVTNTTNPCLSLSGCTQTRLNSNNIHSNTAPYSIVTSGASAGSFGDSSNYIYANGVVGMGAINNLGAGFNFEQRAAAIPTGTSGAQIGDRIPNSVPVVGQPKAWARVTTGTTHTLGVDWINESNL